MCGACKCWQFRRYYLIFETYKCAWCYVLSDILMIVIEHNNRSSISLTSCTFVRFECEIIPSKLSTFTCPTHLSHYITIVMNEKRRILNSIVLETYIAIYSQQYKNNSWGILYLPIRPHIRITIINMYEFKWSIYCWSINPKLISAWLLVL